MSFNITSDGSPTPRKGPSRLSAAAGDLKIDTTPEVLGQAVRGFGQHHHPYALHRAFGSLLTANTQGMKRPIGVSTLGNQQAMHPQQNAFDGYKVSGLPPPAQMTVAHVGYRRIAAWQCSYL
jgi:hypothetical protein